MKLTNKSGLPVSLAVWLATDDYDHDSDPNVISATTLIKPLREIVLARQNKDLEKIGDVIGLVASQMGTAYHNAIEKAWNGSELYETLESLGYPEDVCKRIEINPDPNNLPDNCIPIYMEKRGKKLIEGFTISGKFDFVIEGELEDFKSTSVWAWIFASNDKDYILQGSIYRWLHPQLITGSHLTIRYIFTDWSASAARQDNKYPQQRIVSKRFELMSLPETEAYIRNRLSQIRSMMGATQDQLPVCTPEELWQKPAVYKYYKNPEKTVKSTKNFDNYGDANQRCADDGNVGVVKTVPGQVVKCQYCNVVAICEQANQFVKDGLLIL